MNYCRYYSHYTYIYPNLLLKNYVVEMDDAMHIKKIFPFEQEIERTEFYSGLLAFLPKHKDIQENISDMLDKIELTESDFEVCPEGEFYFIHFEDFTKKQR